VGENNAPCIALCAADWLQQRQVGINDYTVPCSIRATIGKDDYTTRREAASMKTAVIGFRGNPDGLPWAAGLEEVEVFVETVSSTTLVHTSRARA